MICTLPLPGRHAADASLWIGIATLLATLDFNAVKDADGKDIEFEAKFVNGITQWVLMAHSTFSFSDSMDLQPVIRLPSLVTLLLVHTSPGRLSNILWRSDVRIVKSILVQLRGCITC